MLPSPLLSLFQFAHEQLVPFVPGFDVSLEQGLGLVVASVVFVAAALVGRSLRAVFKKPSVALYSARSFRRATE